MVSQSVTDFLGIFNILGGSCNITPVGFVAKEWKCGQFDWAIHILSWVCTLLLSSLLKICLYVLVAYLLTMVSSSDNGILIFAILK